MLDSIRGSLDARATLNNSRLGIIRLRCSIFPVPSRVPSVPAHAPALRPRHSARSLAPISRGARARPHARIHRHTLQFHPARTEEPRARVRTYAARISRAVRYRPRVPKYAHYGELRPLPDCAVGSDILCELPPPCPQASATVPVHAADANRSATAGSSDIPVHFVKNAH
jgi:hypothetical protein